MFKSFIASEFVFVTSAGSFSGGGCSNKRSTSSSASLVAPSDGSTIQVWAGWALSEGTVSITSTFTLVGKFEFFHLENVVNMTYE